MAGAAVLWAGAACGGDAGLGGNGYGNGGVARLETPEAAFDRAFSVVQTVREMPDGRVLVADPLGQALMLVDLDAGGAEVVGAVGEGPDEYQQPDAVWPLPEGRTLQPTPAVKDRAPCNEIFQISRQAVNRGMCAVGFFAGHASRERSWERRLGNGVLGTRASRPH